MLPTDNSDLSTVYSAIDVQTVANIDNNFVCQTATGEYMVHQYKNFIGASTQIQLNWKGKSSQDTSLEPIYLQIYNQQSNIWQTVASDIKSLPGVDIRLEVTILDTSFYVDADQVITCRIFQEAD